MKRAGARNGDDGLLARGHSEDTIRSIGEYFGGIMIDELDENRVPHHRLLELFRDCFGQVINPPMINDSFVSYLTEK